MRYLLLSDVHANAVALAAVLRHAEGRRWQQAIFLGDAVGYYPQPEEVVRELQNLPLGAALLGNHDALLLEPNGYGSAHSDIHSSAHSSARSNARSVVVEILERQRRELSREAHTFLETLTLRAAGPGWEAVHSTLAGNWEYIDSLERAQQEPARMTRPLLFFGHTHVPIIYLFLVHEGRKLCRSVPLTKEKTTFRLPPNVQVLFNPGSVGQPRDGLPLAAYAVYDDELGILEHYRVEFDIRAVQQLVVKADYPLPLAVRLGRGL